MKYPFKVGQHYRNRDGEYKVVRINGSEMVIRYLDGHTIKSSLELQARIWERIQEEEELGETEFDFDDNDDAGNHRKTEEIRQFVDQVLSTIKQPWPPDVTDQVCLAIEQRSSWLSYYHQLMKAFGVLTVNSSIGFYVRELTGMENTGRMATAKSHLLKSYSILTPNQP